MVIAVRSISLPEVYYSLEEVKHWNLRPFLSSVLLLLQLQLPSSAVVEGDLCWNPKNNTVFDYLARGKLRIERQECQVGKTSSTIDLLLVWSALFLVLLKVCFFLAFCTPEWNIGQIWFVLFSQSSLQIKDTQNTRGGQLLCFTILSYSVFTKSKFWLWISSRKICLVLSESSCQFAVWCFKANATADISTAAGRGSSWVRVRADGKDRVLLNAQMSHSLQRGNRAMGLKVNFSQSLLPAATDLHVNMAANISSDRCVRVSPVVLLWYFASF